MVRNDPRPAGRSVTFCRAWRGSPSMRSCRRRPVDLANRVDVVQQPDFVDARIGRLDAHVAVVLMRDQTQVLVRSRQAETASRLQARQDDSVDRRPFLDGVERRAPEPTPGARSGHEAVHSSRDTWDPPGRRPKGEGTRARTRSGHPGRAGWGRQGDDWSGARPRGGPSWQGHARAPLVGSAPVRRQRAANATLSCRRGVSDSLEKIFPIGHLIEIAAEVQPW